MAPPLPNRRTRPANPNRRLLLLLLAAASPLLLLASLHACSALLPHANGLGRQCMPDLPDYSGGPAARKSPRIAIVSFSEEGGGPIGRRSFEGVMEAVEGNKREYAERMGYDYIDCRDLVDRSRPPNWSKILALRSHLPNYDWVFWNDADTLVTNPEISLESILEAAIGHARSHAAPDLVVTEDANGVNSGVFFLRRSNWSENFLDLWWNQTSFIQFGSTKSGDNAAMKHLIDGLPRREFQKHVLVSSMQCLFNSYPWYPTWKSTSRLISSPLVIWKGVYSRGDFMVHLAGFDRKREWAERILQEIKADTRDYIYLRKLRSSIRK